MRELTCRTCGRELNSGLTFCPFCGSKDVVSNAFNNVNNAYAYRRQAAGSNNAYNSAYNNKNYSNNMYGNQNNFQSSSAYSNSTPTDFDKRMNQMQENIRNKSLAKTESQNKRISFNDTNNKFGSNSYTQYNGSNFTSDKKMSNPYVTNKDYYTHNHSNNNFQNQSVSSSYRFDNDDDDESTGMSGFMKGIIAFVAVLAVGAVILFCTGAFDSVIDKVKGAFDGNKTEMVDSSDNNKPALTGSSGTEFGTGELVDNVYTNKWSNVKITLPEGYTNKDEQAYKQYTTEFMSCGLYVENQEGESIVNLYVDLKNDDGTFTEEAYLEENKANYTDYGMEITNSTSNEKVSISGKEYTCMHLTAKSGTVTLTQSIYVRKDGDKACVFMVTSKGENADKNKGIIEAIQPCNE